MSFLFAFLFAFLLFVDPALADPISGAIAAIAGILKVGGIAAAVIKGLIYVGLSIGVSLLQKSLQKKPETSVNGVDLEIKMGDDQPISFPMGNYAVGGKRKYIGVWGADGKTPNAYVVDVIELSSVPITGIVGVWADDQKLTLLTDQVHPEYGIPVSEYRKDGNDYMWIKFHLGTQTTVDSYLYSRFATAADNYIDTNFIGTGIAYAIVTCRYNEDLYSGLPTFTWEPASIALYDIRKDSTNGGSGTHRWDNPATWEPSSNPMIAAYNIIRGYYYNNEWIYGGRNLAAFRLPSSNWIAAINACDYPAATDVGTEPSYRFGYEIKGTQKPLDAVLEILKAANARIAEVGGVFKVVVGAPGASVFSFTDDDIIVTKEQELDPFPNIDSTLNGIEATYPEPDEKWATKDAPARYNSTWEVEDGNRRLTASIALTAVPFKYQVQRIMTSLIQDYRRFRVHQITLSPEAYAIEPNDVISWTSARNGYENKKFMVIQAESDRTFNQLLMIKEVDPSDYDWTSGDVLPTSVGWVGPITPAPHPMNGWTVSPAIIYDAEGNARRPSIKVSCDPDQDDVRAVHVQARLKATGDVYFDSDANYYIAPYEWILQGQFPANVEFEVRGRFLHISDQPNGEWSEWLTVTTPNVLLTDLDVFVDINTDEIIQFVEDSTEWIRDGVRQNILDAQRTAQKILDLDFGTYLDRQQLRTELSSVYEDVTANYKNEISVATGPNSALAQRLETLETTIPNLATASALDLLSAQVDTIDGQTTANATAITALSAGSVSGNTATANFRMSVSAGPSGYSSRIGMEARTGGAGDWRSAQFFIDVPASSASPSRIVMNADQIVMTNGSAYHRPFVYQGGVLYLDNVKANSLESLSAVLGNVDISNANIGTLTVGTSNIEAGAVSTVQTTNSTSLTVNHGPNAPNVLILYQYSGVNAGSQTGFARYELQLNGVAKSVAPSSTAATNSMLYGSSSFVYQPPAGASATTFNLVFTAGTGVDNLSAQITALVFKR